MDIYDSLSGGLAGDVEMGTSVCSLSFYFRVGRSNFPLCFGRNPDPYLPRFIGKPDRLSPKARLLMLARWLPHISMQARPILLLHQTLHHFLTSGFVANGPEPPFDQRDWIVHHPEMGRTRYIIGFFFFWSTSLLCEDVIGYHPGCSPVSSLKI